MDSKAKKICRIFLFSLLGVVIIFLLITVGLLLHWKINLPGWLEKPKAGTVKSNIVYKTVDDRELHLDVYQPGRKLFTKSPTIFYFHGGGWDSGDKDLKNDDDVVNAILKYGITIVSIEYRLTDESTVYPAYLDDCADAIRYMAVHAAEYDVDKNRFCALGASAGGQISLMMSLCGQDYGSDAELAETTFRLKCGVALCAPTDFLNLDVYENEADKAEAAELLFHMFGGTPEKLPEAYKDGSPIYHVNKKAPPIFLAHGMADDIVPFGQASTFIEAAEAVGMDVEFHPAKNANHKFKAADGMETEPTIDELLEELSRFLIRELIL